MDDNYVDALSVTDSEETSDDIDTEFYRAVDNENSMDCQNLEFVVCHIFNAPFFPSSLLLLIC